MSAAHVLTVVKRRH